MPEIHEYTLRELLEICLIISVTIGSVIGTFALFGWIIKETLK